MIPVFSCRDSKGSLRPALLPWCADASTRTHMHAHLPARTACAQVAAGNTNENACIFSPAGLGGAKGDILTVGSIDRLRLYATTIPCFAVAQATNGLGQGTRNIPTLFVAGATSVAASVILAGNAPTSSHQAVISHQLRTTTTMPCADFPDFNNASNARCNAVQSELKSGTSMAAPAVAGAAALFLQHYPQASPQTVKGCDNRDFFSPA